MQRTLLLLAIFFLFFNELNAQNNAEIPLQKGDFIRTLHHQNGRDSVRYGITSSRDTFVVQHYNVYQQLETQRWRLDSFFEYEKRGVVNAKYFKIKALDFEKEDFRMYSVDADSIVKYYPNGQIKELEVGANKSNGVQKLFSHDGELLFFTQKTRTLSPLNFPINYELVEDGFGIKIEAILRQKTVVLNDTFWVTTDTLFHKNGRPKSIEIRKFWNENQLLSYNVFSDKGIMTESLSPDNLKPFKDNISCLYGFKNKNEDTIIKPQFERTEKLDDNRFAAFSGDKCVLLRADGSIVPAPSMTSIQNFSSNSSRLLGGMMDRATNTPRHDGLYKTIELMPYFFYNQGNKKGVIDRNGNVTVPPQYFNDLEMISSNFSGYDVGGNRTNINGGLKYLGFSEYFKGKTNRRDKGDLKRIGYLDLKGNSIFDTSVLYAGYTFYDDYFIVSKNRYSDTVKRNYDFISSTEGLFRAYNEAVLPCVFRDIRPVLFTPLFMVTKYDTLKTGKMSIKEGVFNAETRKWLLDTTFATSIKEVNITTEIKELEGVGLKAINATQYFIYKDNSTKKYGLIDTKGNLILAPNNEQLTVVLNAGNKLILYERQGKYGVFNPKMPQYKYANEYTYLSRFYMGNDYELDEYEVFFAARNLQGKWGVIRGIDEKIVKPFEYDYVGESDKNLALVKNGRATFVYDNYFFSDSLINRDGEFTEDNEATIFSNVYGESNEKFLVKPNGIISIPPQYQLVESESNYYLVEDKKGKRKMIIKKTQEIIDDSELNRIRYYSGKDPLILIDEDDSLSQIQKSDFWNKTMAIYARKTGKKVIPNKHFLIAICDINASVFFVKTDTPMMAKGFISGDICADTLCFIDNNWLMHNARGKIINKVPFRFPIDFKNGLGVGMQGEKTGIFRLDGTALIPPQYQTIWRDNLAGFYYIYDIRGLSSFISVVDKNGKMCIKAANYDAISPFRDKYALIRVKNKIGLVDTSGKEIIAPQDLKNYKGNLLDTFMLGFNEAYDDNPYEERGSVNAQISAFFHTENYLYKTQKLPSDLRNTASNLLLETSINYFLTDKTTAVINRISDDVAKINPSFSSNCRDFKTSFYSQDLTMRSFNRPYYYHFQANQRFISFRMSGFSNKSSNSFINYAFKKDGWALINNPNFWDLKGDKKTDLYNLMVKKIKALKDQEIDCNNSTSLIEQAQNQFLITEEGITVYLNSRSDFKTGDVPIYLSWAELKALIKG